MTLEEFEASARHLGLGAMGLLNPSRVHRREAGTPLKMIMMLVLRKVGQLFREPVSHLPGSWAGTACKQGFQLRFVPPGQCARCSDS